MPLLQKCLQQFHFLFTNRRVYYSRAQVRKENRHHCAKYQTAAVHKHWEDSRTQQAGETLVHYKTPSCIEVALLKLVTRGPGLGCHMPGSAKPWTLRQGTQHASQRHCLLGFPIFLLAPRTLSFQHWHAALESFFTWAEMSLILPSTHTCPSSQLIQGVAPQQEQSLISPLQPNHGMTFLAVFTGSFTLLQRN